MVVLPTAELKNGVIPRLDVEKAAKLLQMNHNTVRKGLQQGVFPWGYIKYQLVEQSSVEYLIRVGVEGLKRIIENNEFTKSEKVAEQIDEYENENNPIKAFIDDCGVQMIENEPTGDVYRRYQVFCADGGMQPMSKGVFSKQINKRLGFETSVTRVG